MIRIIKIIALVVGVEVVQSVLALLSPAGFLVSAYLCYIYLPQSLPSWLIVSISIVLGLTVALPIGAVAIVVSDE